MKPASAYVITVLAFLLAIASYFGDQSYTNLKQLRVELEQEKERNQELRGQLKYLKKIVWNTKHDPRAIEKQARNKYAMARKNDVVVFFND